MSQARPPDIVLLEIETPGPTHSSLSAGAWGDVATSDGERAMLDAIEQVAAGEFAMSEEVRAGYGT